MFQWFGISSCRANKASGSFFHSSLSFLGHFVSEEGALSELEKAKAIVKLVQPTYVHILYFFLR